MEVGVEDGDLAAEAIKFTVRKEGGNQGAAASKGAAAEVTAAEGDTCPLRPKDAEEGAACEMCSG